MKRAEQREQSTPDLRFGIDTGVDAMQGSNDGSLIRVPKNGRRTERSNPRRARFREIISCGWSFIVVQGIAFTGFCYQKQSVQEKGGWQADLATSCRSPRTHPDSRWDA